MRAGGHIRHTASPALFRNVRYGVHGYDLAVPYNGQYAVTINESELSAAKRINRVFSIDLQGHPIARGLNIVKAAGRDTAYSVHGTAVVTDGHLRLRFVQRDGSTQVNSIKVVAVGQSAPAAVPGGSGFSASRQGAVVTPEDFGAVGDGRTDDTAALQRFLDAGNSANTLDLPAGKTYAFSSVLHITNDGTLLQGSGTLLATREATSSIWVQGDDVTIDGPMTFRTQQTTKRWTAWEQMGLRIDAANDTTVRGVTIDGSAAAGLYVGNGSRQFTLVDVTVENTRADGIHMTGGASEGQVISPTVKNTGDDGIAVVSYKYDKVPCSDITVTGARVLGTTWGRGMSVVGGSHITYRNMYVERSDAAAIYIAAEGNPYYTFAPRDVLVTNGILVDSNVDAAVDHGAVLVMSGENDVAPANVTITGMQIRNTRSTASWNCGVVTYGASPSGVTLNNFTITGGPGTALGGNSGSYRAASWTHNGTNVPDHQ